MTDDLTPNQQPSSSTSRAESHLHNVLGQASSLTDHLANELGAPPQDATPSSPSLDLNEPENNSTPLDGQLEQIDELLRDAEQQLGSMIQPASQTEGAQADFSSPRHSATVPDFMNEFIVDGGGSRADATQLQETNPSPTNANENYDVPDFMSEFTSASTTTPPTATSPTSTQSGAATPTASHMREPISAAMERSAHAPSTGDGGRSEVAISGHEPLPDGDPRAAATLNSTAAPSGAQDSPSKMGKITLVSNLVVDMLVKVLEAIDRPLGWVGDRTKRTLGWLAAVMLLSAAGLYIWSRI